MKDFCIHLKQSRRIMIYDCDSFVEALRIALTERDIKDSDILSIELIIIE